MKTLALDHRFLSLRYEDVGTGLPVVLLHAFPFDHAMWTPQLEALADAGLRAIAPDLPEFGESTPGSEVFAIERGADVIAELLDALDIEKAVIVGLSMGGYIAMAFAHRHRHRLRGLILADTKAAPDDANAKANRDRLIADVKGGGTSAAVEALFPKLFAEETRQRNPDRIGWAREIALRQRPTAIIAGLYALRDRPDAAPGLAAVAAPTLVLVGEHDAVTPPLAAARIAGTIPGAELVHVPSAGHMSNIENPEAFNAATLAFLKQVQ